MEVALLNSYFVYDRQVYIQLQGFFMGVRPAPLGAIIKMWYLERNSIYADLRLKTVFYGRFYDDIGSVGDSKRRAQIMINSIEAHDPDKLIKLTLDYPEKKEDFSPFLNVEFKVSSDGKLSTRLFRKPQKKLLTLNASSHHPITIKEHTVANMYKTASNVSSCDKNRQHSEKMVDELLLNNGYQNKELKNIKLSKTNKHKTKANANSGMRH